MGAGCHLTFDPLRSNGVAIPVADQHIHITAVTGMMWMSEFRKMLPCSRCDWGHEPDRVVVAAKIIFQEVFGEDAPPEDATLGFCVNAARKVLALQTET